MINAISKCITYSTGHDSADAAGSLTQASKK